MFTVADRDRVRRRLLDLARSDPEVVGAAVTGSSATGASDRFSDIDLAFAVDGDVATVMRRWTATAYADLAAVHHWDLVAGASTYRVFLLPGLLEVDLSFTPVGEYGPRGPAWRVVFGQQSRAVADPPPDTGTMIGRGWHHARLARVCIERGRSWQAEYWISALRDLVIALACARSGLPSAHGKAAHRLPDALTQPLTATLVRSLDRRELVRAHGAAVAAFHAQVREVDLAVAERLRPALEELTGEVSEPAPHPGADPPVTRPR